MEKKTNKAMNLLEMCSRIAGRVRNYWEINGGSYSTHQHCYDGFSGFVSTGTKYFKHQNPLEKDILMDIDGKLEIISRLREEDDVEVVHFQSLCFIVTADSNPEII